MKKITEHYKIGIVSEDFTGKSLADKLNLLTSEKINYLKGNTEPAAQELNADKNEIIFKELVSSVVPLK